MLEAFRRWWEGMSKHPDPVSEYTFTRQLEKVCSLRGANGSKQCLFVKRKGYVPAPRTSHE